MERSTTGILRVVLVMMLGTGVLGAMGCATTPASAEGKAALKMQAKTTVSHFMTVSPAVAKVYFNSARGYAVFPSIAKGGLVVGGAHGQGVLYENGVIVGYCSVSQATIGAQIGGQSYSEIIFFKNKVALDQFKAGSLDVAAQATAVAANSGASANAAYSDGVAVASFDSSGLMGEATVGGQKFNYQPK